MCLRLPVCALFVFFCAAHAASESDNQWHIVSMGDSITAGFNTRWPGDFNNVRYNWSTGTSNQVKSHLHKLKKIISQEVKAINVAKSRATSYNLAEQLNGVKATTINYLTVLIGANDVCDWTEEYAEDMRKFSNNVSTSSTRLSLTTTRCASCCLPFPTCIAFTIRVRTPAAGVGIILKPALVC